MASLMQWAARSTGLVRLNEPRNDLASGVRELATTTASLMAVSFPAGEFSGLYPKVGRLRYGAAPIVTVRPPAD